MASKARNVSKGGRARRDSNWVLGARTRSASSFIVVGTFAEVLTLEAVRTDYLTPLGTAETSMEVFAERGWQLRVRLLHGADSSPPAQGGGR